jgi:hypothetical protein
MLTRRQLLTTVGLSATSLVATPAAADACCRRRWYPTYHPCPARRSAVRGAAAPKAGRSDREIWFYFEEPFLIGTCLMDRGAQWTFQSGGKGRFTGRVQSSEGGGRFLQYFEVYRADGGLLFRIPPSGGGVTWWWYQDMPSAHVWYSWARDFDFPAAHYGSISKTTVWGQCDT